MTPEALAAVLRDTLGDPSLEVDALARLTGGTNSETWRFETVARDGARRTLILRMRSHGDSAITFATEAAALDAAARAGVPEPEVIAYDDDAAAIGSPYLITTFVDGETAARRIIRDDAFAAVRPRLAADCGAALARIHEIPVAEIPGLELLDPLPYMRGLLDRFEDPLPAHELAYRRLAASGAPDNASPVVVHGDFRNGNLIVTPDGIAAVLDWELMHLGDPMQDLGYLCARAWRFGGTGPVGGFGERADLFAGYEQAGGRPVDPDAVAWWQLWSTMWWGVGCLEMSSRHLSGALPSIELAAVGRRAWEQEYDVALMLERRGLMDRGIPTSAELLQAVSELLGGEVLPALRGSAQFDVRVALHVLGIVERELHDGPAVTQAHALRLASLGVADDTELVAAIRAGRFDDRESELIAALRDSTRERLRVQQPRYLCDADR